MMSISILEELDNVMDVILDSNQILTDPHMEGDRIQSLFRYLRRTSSSLVIPKIVQDEVLARYIEQLKTKHKKLVDARDRFAETLSLHVLASYS
jgi:rRNA-processing protein FCF1